MARPTRQRSLNLLPNIPKSAGRLRGLRRRKMLNPRQMSKQQSKKATSPKAAAKPLAPEHVENLHTQPDPKEVTDIAGHSDPAPETPSPSVKESGDWLSPWVGKYWRSSRHIAGYGEVRGKVTREALERFVGLLPEESLKNLGKFIADSDVHAKHDLQVKRKISTN